MLDKDGVILTWNPGCELMKGYKAEEVIGQNYSMLFPSFLRDKHLPEKEIAIAKENGRYETENWRRPKSGELFWAFVVLTKITDDSGKFVGFVKITQDQSEKKKLHDQLQSKIEDFKRMNTDLNNFAYTASHDLKAPINNIEGLSLLLKSELENRVNNDGISKIVELMHQSALKFKVVITDMARAAQEESEHYTYQSFKDVVDDIKLLLSNDIKTVQAVFHEDYAEAPFVRYPTKHIRSILQNLITNAIKYKSPKRKPEITIKTTLTEGYTLLEVADNGMGIEEEDKKRIFSMYQRVDNDTVVEGTGVGLGLVAKLVEGNHGKIEVESKVGKGSKFKIFLR
ncbi:sensor histidine kinase [Pontibacter harenae]|uniref:sensor histidine kinase n=1 Tax=Pontibacter harenae TaxID=2894083 RepID=UPI001E4FD982|nr:PAS domain-containing sensor histidine kinase [Pontibacter harenae]MCC9168404.1 PAS domain-containing sensor histidine kinase [Pontibacter harenae]